MQKCIDAQGELLKQILARLNSGQNTENQEEYSSKIDLETFPLTSLEKFNELESTLQTSSSIRNSCVKFFKTTGGSGKQIIQYMLRKSLNDHVAAHFTFFGTSSKKSFTETQLFRIMKHEYFDEDLQRH